MSKFFRPSLYLMGISSLAHLTFNLNDIKNRYLSSVRLDEKSSLKMAMIFFRHGKRTPILNNFLIDGVNWPEEWVDLLPCAQIECNLKNSRYWPPLKQMKLDNCYKEMGLLNNTTGKGLVTIQGQKDSLELGRKLRKIYIEDHAIVPAKYTDDDVRLYSTYINRTLNSLKCLLSGMFDIEGSVPTIYTRLNEYEIYFPNYAFCTKYNRFYNTAISLEDRIYIHDLNKRRVAQKLDQNAETLPSVLDIWEEIYCLVSNGIEIPEKYQNSYDFIKKAATQLNEYRMFDSRRLSIKLASGQMLGELYETIKKKILSPGATQNLHIFSVHDTTLMAIMKAFKFFPELEWPDCSSYIAFELHEKNSTHFIKIIYNDVAVKPNGYSDEMIPIKEFHKMISNVQLDPNMNFLDICERGPAQGYDF